MSAGTELWRIDAGRPEEWSWLGFPRPRHRFDPASGGFRTRYASTNLPGAARERYLDTGRYIPADHAAHHLVRLVNERPLRVLDLRTEANLDALDVDDQISTGHHPRVLATAHRLADAVRSWWDELDGIVYRSRTTPETSVNVAFFSLDGLAATTTPLADAGDVLDDLVLTAGFTVGFDW